MNRFTRVMLRWLGVIAATAGLAMLSSLSGTAVRAGWDTAPSIDWPDGERETYAVFDTLFIQRNNASYDTPLIVNVPTGTTVFSAADVQFATAPGVRVVLGEHGPRGVGWEFGYVGVYGMFGSDVFAVGPSDALVPPLTSGVYHFPDASIARATYSSTLNMAEANLLFTHCHVNDRRRSGYSMERQRRETTIDWITGFRWAGLDEQASLAFASSATAPASGFAVRTSSNLFAGQLGLRGRTQWQVWAVEGQLKAGLAGASLAGSTSVIGDPSPVLPMPGGGAQAATVGGIFEMNTSIVRRLGESWWLRLGYNSFWLTGVSLAPDQSALLASPQDAPALDANQTVWLTGANLGVEKRW